MEAKCGHIGRWWILHVCLLIVLTQVESGFIDFRPGYEYIYRLNATADVVSVGKFLLRAKISYTNIQELLDSQELLLRVYGFQFSPIGQPDVRGHDFDFSSWFSFVITKHGVILRVYHDEDDPDEVIAIKKGIAGLLSAKLHSEDEVPGSTKGGHYSYTTEEVGHEGPHTADYIVFPTAEGKAFKKTRTNFDHQVENVKSNFEKTLHFHDELGTIHKVLVEEDFTGPTKSKPGFDPYFAMRKVEPAQKFGNVEYPEMKAISDAELHFLTRERALFDTNKPLESIKSASVHVSNHIPRRLPVEKNIDVAWDAIRGNLSCMSNQPAKGSPELSTCFFDIVNVLKRLPAEHLDTIAEFYFTNLSSFYPDNAAARHNMLDAYGVLNTYLSQTILLQRVLLAPTLDEDLVQRVLVQVVAMKTPPIQNITSVIEEMAFDSAIIGRKVSMTTCHRAQMALGSVIRKMKENNDTYSKHLTGKMHEMLGMHDPWKYVQKRSTMTESEQYDHDREKVVLLESLGNARMNHSYDYIISHINATNSPWIKRAGVHALRHYHHDDAADQLLLTALYDDDENVRFEALLQYQAHPKSRVISPLNNRAHPNDSYVFDPYASGIQDVAIHHRDRRGLMNFLKLNLHFHLEAPGVDWRKELGSKDIGASFGIVLKNMLDIKIAPLEGHLKVEVNNEAYARAHIGMLDVNFDFFLARLCFIGGAEYNLNIFQEMDPNMGFNLVKQFDALVKNVVGAIKGGIELFRDLINGNFNDFISGFVQALEELPNMVTHLPGFVRALVSKLGQLNVEKLPPFIRPLKELVTRVTNLFNEIKNGVMTFYNKVVEAVTITIPQSAKQIFQSIKGIIGGFKNIFKDPMTAIGDIGKGIMGITMSIQEVLRAKDDIMEIFLSFKDKKPNWMDLGSQIEIIMDMAFKAGKALAEGGKQWAEKIIDHSNDPISQFTGGRNTSASVKNQVVQELLSIAQEITAPFKNLTGLGGKFFETLTKVIELVKNIKNAYDILKEGYRIARSIIDRIFGPKCHKDFPRETRIQGGGCNGDGFYPSKLDAGSGVKEYQYQGVDLRVEEDDMVVAPFAGIAIRSDNSNEVIITNVEKLPKGTEIVITNVYPNSSILHTNDPDYIELRVAAGDPIGTATRSACKATDHIHFAIKKGEDTMDPTRYLSPRFPKLPVWVQKCDDYKLVFMDDTIAEDCIVCMEGRDEDETTPKLENTDDPKLGEVDDKKDPGQDTDNIKSDSNSMYSRLHDSADVPMDTAAVADSPSDLGDKIVGGIKNLINQTAVFLKKFSLRKIKLGSIIEFLHFLHMDQSKVAMAEVIKTIKEVLDNKPCENPRHMTDDQLSNELSNRGLSAVGSREELIEMLLDKDGSKFNNHFFCMQQHVSAAT